MGAKPKITMPVMPEAPKPPPAMPQQSPTTAGFEKAGRKMAEGLATSGTMLTSRRGAGSLMPTASGMKTLLGA